jgi:hypothetical protein
VYPYLPSSLDCPFSLPQDTGQTNVREYRKEQKKRNNPEKLATQSTQGTAQINVREYRRGNEKGPSVLSNIYLCCTLCTLCCQFLLIVLFYCPLWYSLTFICDNVFSNVFVTYEYGLDNITFERLR